jgi:GntR family transcriptional regulator
MQDLVAEGLVYRVPGRGTFPATHDQRYLHRFGSVEDLMGLSRDTVLEVVEPLQRRVDLDAAGRLRLDSDLVHTLSFRRLHDGMPLCFTTVAVPSDVGRLLCDEPTLREPGARSPHTVLGLLDTRLEHPVLEAEQSISVGALPPVAARCLDLPDGSAALRVDRVYTDARQRVVELAVSWFHPDHYSYRVRLRRSGH